MDNVNTFNYIEFSIVIIIFALIGYIIAYVFIKAKNNILKNNKKYESIWDILTLLFIGILMVLFIYSLISYMFISNNLLNIILQIIPPFSGLFTFVAKLLGLFSKLLGSKHGTTIIVNGPGKVGIIEGDDGYIEIN